MGRQLGNLALTERYRHLLNLHLRDGELPVNAGVGVPKDMGSQYPRRDRGTGVLFATSDRLLHIVEGDPRWFLSFDWDVIGRLDVGPGSRLMPRSLTLTVCSVDGPNAVGFYVNRMYAQDLVYLFDSIPQLRRGELPEGLT